MVYHCMTDRVAKTHFLSSKAIGYHNLAARYFVRVAEWRGWRWGGGEALDCGLAGAPVTNANLPDMMFCFMHHGGYTDTLELHRNKLVDVATRCARRRLLRS